MKKVEIAPAVHKVEIAPAKPKVEIASAIHIDDQPLTLEDLVTLIEEYELEIQDLKTMIKKLQSELEVLDVDTDQSDATEERDESKWFSDDMMEDSDEYKVSWRDTKAGGRYWKKDG
jgi:hypothetical protein